MFNYIEWLGLKFSQIIENLKLDVQIKISDEQQFVKDKDKQSDILYIVIKQFSGPNSYGVKTIPYQILVMSEQNQLEIAKTICNQFASENNFATVKIGNEYVKHSYSQPAVMSNFNQIDVGVRSIIYISAVLTIMNNLLFLNSGDENGSIDIDGETIKVLSFNMAYIMTPDTQALPSEELSQSKKSVASLTISFEIPLKNSEFVVHALSIMKGGMSGNRTFNVSFNYGENTFNLSMKIISANITENPEQAPGLKVGLMV